MKNDNRDLPIFDKDHKQEVDILIIDDDDSFLTTVKSHLELKGYSVDTAPEGATGLTLIRKNHYKVIGTDIIMPGSDGYEVILEVRRMGMIDKMIAWSGGGRTPAEDYLVTARHFGVTDTFTIPLDIATFREAVEKKIQLQK